MLLVYGYYTLACNLIVAMSPVELSPASYTASTSSTLWAQRMHILLSLTRPDNSVHRSLKGMGHSRETKARPKAEGDQHRRNRPQR